MNHSSTTDVIYFVARIERQFRNNFIFFLCVKKRVHFENNILKYSRYNFITFITFKTEKEREIPLSLTCVIVCILHKRKANRASNGLLRR